MRTNVKLRTAAEVLVDQLSTNGVRDAFCVPGESYLAVLDAFCDRDIRVTACRQEGGAAMMAEAIGKATGRPGVCFVTRGPGATNASAGVYIAHEDSTPMILFVGQISRQVKERAAFQELDLRALFGGITKWTADIDNAARLPEMVSRAFYTATSGRPGPVVLGLPQDMLTEEVAVASVPPFEPVETWPAQSDMGKLETLLLQSKRPFLILGGSRWSERASAAIQRFAERFALPVATSYRRAPLFDPLHPCYVGDLGIGPNPKLIAHLKSADLIMALGGRLGEIPTQGYTLFEIPAPQTKLIHIHPCAEELGRVYRPYLAIHAAPTAFAELADVLQLQQSIPWRDQTAATHADYLAWSQTATEQPGDVNLGSVMVWLREQLPRDAILCNGAGNYAAWIHRYYRFRHFATHIAPTVAAMGYGIPAAVAMKRLHPERTVVSLNGDGDFLMNGQEFATAVQYNLQIIVIICDNGMYGTIRMHQEREYPGRLSATTLRNPDFASYARSFGGYGVLVEKTEDFPAAFSAAEQSGKPAIIHLKIDPEAITPVTTLTKIREKTLTATRS